MIRATIRTPAGYYVGESVTEEVPARATDNALRAGWHNRNHVGDMIDALVFSDTPKEHYGELGINGALSRILRYMRHGHMPVGEIVINVLE